jgi:hypothetical protein
MRRDIIAMSQKERQRYHLLKMVTGGRVGNRHYTIDGGGIRCKENLKNNNYGERC